MVATATKTPTAMSHTYVYVNCVSAIHLHPGSITVLDFHIIFTAKPTSES